MGVHTDDQLCQIADHAKRAGTTNAVGHAGFAVAADANVCMDPASDGPVLFALPQNSKNTKSSPPDL